MKTINLEAPIQRGDKCIDAITLRKPKAGELRGIKITDLLNLDVAALIRVVPRISDPTLTEQDVGNMDLADLTNIGGEIAAFFLTKAELAAIGSPTT